MLLYGLLRLLLDPLRADGRPERFLGISHQQGIAIALIGVALLWPWTFDQARRWRVSKPPTSGPYPATP
jgi:hypothetical protein